MKKRQEFQNIFNLLLTAILILPMLLNRKSNNLSRMEV